MKFRKGNVKRILLVHEKKVRYAKWMMTPKS